MVEITFHNYWRDRSVALCLGWNHPEKALVLTFLWFGFRVEWF